MKVYIRKSTLTWITDEVEVEVDDTWDAEDLYEHQGDLYNAAVHLAHGADPGYPGLLKARMLDEGVEGDTEGEPEFDWEEAS